MVAGREAKQELVAHLSQKKVTVQNNWQERDMFCSVAMQQSSERDN